jgi:hypothetical protein
MVDETYPLLVQTMLRVEENVFKRLNNIVYIYDPSWVLSSDPDSADTLPFAIFYVVNEEIRQTQSVSKKRLILYNSTDSENDTSDFTRGVISVVADNVVNEPTVHRLECIVPFNPLTVMIDGTVSSASTVLDYASSSTSDVIKDIINVIKSLLDSAVFLAHSVSSVINWLPFEKGSDFNLLKPVYDINRRSILAMARRRAFVVYKSWQDWQVKSVVITDAAFKKEGTEDNVFRASLELQELPILYTGTAKPVGKRATFNKPLTTGIKAAFEKATSFAQSLGG